MKQRDEREHNMVGQQTHTSSYMASALVAGLALCANPAMAITGGQMADAPTSSVVLQVYFDTFDGPVSWDCSGVLVAPRVVVTGAFCVSGFFGGSFSANDMYMRVGDASGLDSPSEGASAQIDSFVVHQSYNDNGYPSSLGDNDDIGLILLRDPVTVVDPTPIMPSEVADALLATSPTLRMEGYGDTSDGGLVLASGPLRYLERTVTEVGTTEFRLGQSSDDVGACLFDEGGPVHAQVEDPSNPDGPDLNLVLGTMARYAPSSSGCGGDDVFTLLPAYIDWVVDNADGLYEPFVMPEPPPEPEPEPESDAGEPEPAPVPDLPDPGPGPDDDAGTVDGDDDKTDTTEPEAGEPETTEPDDVEDTPSGPDFDPDTSGEPTGQGQAASEADEPGFNDAKNPSAENPRTFVVRDYEHEGGCSSTGSSGRAPLLLLLLCFWLRRRATPGT